MYFIITLVYNKSIYHKYGGYQMPHNIYNLLYYFNYKVTYLS